MEQKVNMKVYILHTGFAEINSNYMVRDDTAATRFAPNQPHRLLKVPFLSLLIEHPEAGWILYDTGIPDDPTLTWTEPMLEVRLTKPEECRMENQLKLAGITPDDVKHVIISHLHQDHMGNAHLFQHACFYVGRAEMAQAALALLEMTEEEYKNNFFYLKNEVFLDVRKRVLIEEDEELFPGVEVILLPGHTAGIMGLVLHLEHGTLIATADAVNVQRNYDGMIPGQMYDSLSWWKSLKKVKKLKQKYDASIIYGHDIEQFEHSLKLAPAYYD